MCRRSLVYGARMCQTLSTYHLSSWHPPCSLNATHHGAWGCAAHFKMMELMEEGRSWWVEGSRLNLDHNGNGEWACERQVSGQYFLDFIMFYPPRLVFLLGLEDLVAIFFLSCACFVSTSFQYATVGRPCEFWFSCVQLWRLQLPLRVPLSIPAVDFHHEMTLEMK